MTERNAPEPDEIINRAGRLLTGTPDQAGRRIDLTLTMRDLFVARDRLGFFDSVRADVLLARPTDGLQDPAGDGYRGGAERVCGKRLCVHYAKRGGDAPRSEAWVQRTLRVLGDVWSFEVDDLGLRRPPADGGRGGDKRFDVYLADLGSRGLFGYCTPEARVRGELFAASGYCVLDDDFARRQYAARPLSSLRVTAAHEFFHAIQFGYDFREDPWLLESTATWMEDQFADGSDDNRRYLRYGSLRRPAQPIDLFSNTRYAQYGNWAFWQFLSERFGARIVREVWDLVDARRGPDEYSVEALRDVLAARGGLPAVLAAFEAASLDPADHYDEGAHWPRARVSRRLRLGPDDRSSRTLQVDHLAADNLRIVPADDAAARRTRLVVVIDGPDRSAAPAASLEIRRTSGRVQRRVVDLDRRGRGRAVAAFGARRTASVVVTAVNASTRYRCYRDTSFACSGKPLDQGRGFRITAAVRRR